MNALIASELIFCVWMLLCKCSEVNGAKSRVLLLSFDGFRWDYVGKFPTPNLDAFAREGVHAPMGVTTAFATKTFPDHYTIATGLYAESHGIVNNKMFDPIFNATFRIGNLESRWWDGGQPIWTTATLQGLKAAVYFWPGSEVELDGVRPLHWRYYKKDTPFEHRVDTVVDWLTEGQVDFAASYYYEPDGTGHRFGPESTEVGQAVQRVDTLLGYLAGKLKAEGIYDTTNIIVVSDHGMATVTLDDEHMIYLSDYLDLEKDIEIIPDEGTLVNIRPREGRLERVFNQLRGAHRNMTVYKKENMPERFHYKSHRRIQPIVALADEGFYIYQNRAKKTKEATPGQHGYDNGLSSMRPIFLARGPNFKIGHNVSTSYETVNVYSLLCRLLDIQPAANNGTIRASEDMLKDDANNEGLEAPESRGSTNGGNNSVCPVIPLLLIVCVMALCQLV